MSPCTCVTLEQRILLAQSYAGIVFNDLNADGIRDVGEPGLAAIIFNDRNDNRVHDLTDYNLADAAADGAFAFDFPYTGAAPVQVDVRAEPGWLHTTPPVTIQKDQPRQDLQFGLAYRPATLQGRAFIDANGNGAWDDGEDPFHHAIFHFGQSWAGSQAELDGAWSMTIAAGVETTLVLDPEILAIADLTTGTAGWTRTAALNEVIDLGDIGLQYHPTRFSGLVLLDPDFDLDDTDASIPVVDARVFADLNGNKAFDLDEPFAMTDADGFYALDVPPDTAMHLLVEPPAGLQLIETPDLTVTSELGRDIGRDFSLRRWADAVQALPTDFDADGEPDIVFAVEGGACILGPTPAGNVIVPAPAGYRFAAAADFDQDGYADIVWQHPTTGQARITLLQDAQPQSTSDLPTTADARWRIIGAGDLNNDGHHDLLWRHADTGVLTAWRMHRLALAGFTVVAHVPNAQWQIAAVLDMDFDGDADLVWHNQSTNALLQWRLNNGHVDGFRMIAVPRQPIHYIAVARSAPYDPITFLGARGTVKQGLLLQSDAYGLYTAMSTWAGGA